VVLWILRVFYTGYNHARTENIDEQGGAYSLTETYLLASGTALENFEISIENGLDSSLERVSVQGNVEGLETLTADQIGRGDVPTKYPNASGKFNDLITGGVLAPIFLRAKSASEAYGSLTFPLNSTPLSRSIGTNEIVGTISYNFAYDNRASNIITGTDSEVISIQDTLPGDLFVSIPILGRATGPLLQFINTRTEHRRALSIELVMSSGWKDSNYLNALLTKPSLTSPQKTELDGIINGVSPKNDSNIVRYFVNPSPTENWNPREGRYSFNIEWTYELSE